MIKSLIPKIIILLLISISSCKTQQKKVLQEHYTFKKGDYNGIGKWYLGREIAYVMGFEGINWLERSSREKEENIRRSRKTARMRHSD